MEFPELSAKRQALLIAGGIAAFVVVSLLFWEEFTWRYIWGPVVADSRDATLEVPARSKYRPSVPSVDAPVSPPAATVAPRLAAGQPVPNVGASAPRSTRLWIPFHW